MRKKIAAILFSVLCVFSLCGCNKSDDALAEYKANVENFYAEAEASNERINSIDAESETAAEELLDELDYVKTNFQNFADLEVPEEYESVESLADSAAQLMNDAVDMYHSSYEEGTFNEFTAGMAYEKYCRAIETINAIGDILQGKTPQSDNITVTTEE